MEWKNIETAPLDGTVVDLWHKNGFRVSDVWYDDEDEIWTNLLPTSDFTHWIKIENP